MTSEQIWAKVNEQRDLVFSIYQAICAGGDISDGMSELKRRIPCLFGADEEERALVFKSIDDGLVAVMVHEQDGTFALVLVPNIALE
jgi:hypothetical protein